MDDIAIIDLDVKKTTWSRVHSSMRTLYLKLSAEPDLDWIRFFREERESRFIVKRHGLWIEDGYIVFDCLLRDVEPHHLPDFRLSIAYANRMCRDLRAKRRSESRQRRSEARGEQELLESLRAAIRGPDESAPPAPVAAVEAGLPAAFGAKRDDLRRRLRTALKNRTKESDRGND